jgi:hypothetical protein
VAFEAALALARSYGDPREELAVWDETLPHLDEQSDRARGQRERARVVLRISRAQPLATPH